SQAGVGHLIDARPNRAGSRLNRYRSSQTLPGLTPGSGGSTDLGDDLSQVEVRQSRLVDGTANENAVQRIVPSSITNPRMNSFAALSGYQHGRELWDTMRGYGLSPAQYSKFAQHPLRARYRGPINPGPGKDGKTVNA